MLALTIIGGAIGGFVFHAPRYVFLGAFIGGMNIAPFTWFIKSNAKFNAQVRHSNIFYENGTTKEEIEQI